MCRAPPIGYLNIAIGIKEHPLVPVSYGLVGGGSVWQVVCGKKASEPNQKLLFLPPVLVGASCYKYELKDKTIGLHARNPGSGDLDIVREGRAKFALSQP